MRADLAVATENHEFDRLALFEVVKRGANNRIAMKIYLAAIFGSDEAMVFDRNETVNGWSTEDTIRKLDAVRWLHRVAYHYWRITLHLRVISDSQAGHAPVLESGVIEMEED